MPSPTPPNPPSTRSTDLQAAQTLALRVIAFVLVAAACSLLSSVLVPFAIAIVLAVSLSPVADWLEQRLGFGRTLSSLAMLLLVTTVILATGALLIMQAGTVLADSDRYLDRLSGTVASISKATGADRLIESIGEKDGTADGPSTAEGGPRAYWDRTIARSTRSIGTWVVQGLGGVLGALGGLVHAADAVRLDGSPPDRRPSARLRHTRRRL
jgi:predicted PurR-regulated permease PerM